MAEDSRTLVALVLVFAPLSLVSIGGGPATLAEMQHQAVAVHAWVTQREFADLFAAWDSLSQDLKDKLETMHVVHCFKAVGPRFYDNPTAADFARWDAVFPPTEHPLVWHQKDGRTALLIGVTALGIVGMDEEEGAEFLENLVDLCTKPEFVYRHKWKAGDMVMFNNPGLLHRSLPYDKASLRLMHRTTIKGTEMIQEPKVNTLR